MGFNDVVSHLYSSVKKFTGGRSLAGCTKHKTCFLLGIITCFVRKWRRLKG